jgi:hypothetical protein
LQLADSPHVLFRRIGQSPQFPGLLQLGWSILKGEGFSGEKTPKPLVLTARFETDRVSTFFIAAAFFARGLATDGLPHRTAPFARQ